MTTMETMKLFFERREEYGPVDIKPRHLYRTMAGDLVYCVQCARVPEHAGKNQPTMEEYKAQQKKATGPISGYMFFVLEARTDKVPVGAGFETDPEGFAPQDIRYSIMYEVNYVLEAEFPQTEHIPEDGDTDYEI